MLCFGQSAYFRFNHPEEALYMKSLLPGGLSSPRSQPDGKNHHFLLLLIVAYLCYCDVFTSEKLFDTSFPHRYFD